MASDFPGAVDSFLTKVDNVDKYMAAHMNDVQNAIVAVQTELGINPAGPSATVAALLESLITGWVPDADTWVYVAANQFKIVGKDVTSRFPVGLKLKCTNGGSLKQFYGIGAAMSGSDTLVTITGGSDYSLSGGAITENYYGYGDPLPGFPGWFNASTAGAVGWSTLPSDFRYRFYVVGRICHINIYNTIDGVSNSTTTSLVLPISVSPGSRSISAFQFLNNGTRASTPGMAIAEGSSLLLYTLWNFGAWIGTGAKAIDRLEISYQI